MIGRTHRDEADSPNHPSPSSLPESQSATKPSEPQRPKPCINGRYEVAQAISSGPGGKVLRVRDRFEPDPRRAYRILKALDLPANDARHHEELARLCSLRHPNLNPTIDFGRVTAVEGGTGTEPSPGAIYLVSPEVDGQHLGQAMAQWGGSADADGVDRWLTGITIQILRVLRFLHDLSFVHFDIKPEHILLGSEEHAPGVPHITLIDLGLAARESTPLGNRVRGTAPFMAPEVLAQSVVDPRVDLFALGATLEHVLTNTAEEIPVPEFWRGAITRLTQENPEHRYRNCSELLEELRARPAGENVAATTVLVGRAPRLVGQEKEFDYVAREVEKLEVGEAGSALILLGGDEGIGKRAVAQRLLELARLRGVQTYGARCRARGDAPLDPLLHILRQIRQTSPSSTLDGLINFLDGAIGRSSSTEPLIDRDEDRVRFQARLADAIVRLERVPRLILVEDLHHAAPELIECLAILAHRVALQRNPAPGEAQSSSYDPDRPGAGDTLLLCTVHSNREPEDARSVPGRVLSVRQLARETHVARIALKPLTSSRSKELVRDLLGPQHFAANTYAKLHERSNGRWSDLISLIHEAHAAGRLRREAHGWTWEGDVESIPSITPATLSTGEHLCTELLAAAEAPLPRSLVEHLLRERGESDPTHALRQLELEGWIDRTQLHGVDEVELVRPIDSDRVTTTQWRHALAMEELTRRPDNPLSAISLLLDSDVETEVEASLPRAFEVLERHHCDASAVELIARLGARTTPLDPEWRIFESDALLALGQPRDALAAAEAATASGDPAVRMRAWLVGGRAERRLGRNDAATESFERALELAERSVPLETEVDVHIEQIELQLDRGEQRDALARIEQLRARVDDAEAGFVDPEIEAKIALVTAHTHGRRGTPQRAQKALESLLNESKGDMPANWRARLTHELAEINFNSGHYDRAFELYEASLPLDTELENHKSRAHAETQLGRIHYNRGERDQSLEHYRQSLRIRQQIGDLSGIAACHNNIGLIHRAENRIDAAESSFEYALRIFEELEFADRQAIVLNNISDCKLARGEYHQALRYNLRGLEKRKGLSNRSGIAFSYYRIALVYQKQGELERARDYVDKSLEIRRELGDRLSTAHSLQVLGELHLIRSRYGDAFRAFRQGLSNFQALGDRSNRLPVLMALGNLYQRIGQYDEAASHIEQSLELAQKTHLDEFYAQSLSLRAQLHLDLGSLSAAESDVNEAERILRRQTLDRQIAEILVVKGRLAIELGNRERALTTLAELYSHVERLGLLDLYPPYYLLRGQLALDDPAELEMARKLLRRGVEEAEKLELGDETWRLHYRLGLAESRRGDQEASQRAFDSARSALRRVHDLMPSQFQETYRTTGDRPEIAADFTALTDLAAAEAAATPTPVVEPEPVEEEAGESRDSHRLQNVLLLLTSERNLQVLLERIMDEVLDLFGAERGYLILTEDGDLPSDLQSDENAILVSRNIDRDEVGRPEFRYSRSIAREVIETGREFVTNDASTDERLREATSVHDLRLQAIACFPLEWQGDRLGVIYLENRFRKRLIDPQRVRMLEAFSSQASVAIVNARLNEENRTRQQELERSKEQIERLNQQLEVRVEEQSRELEITRRELEQRQTQLEERYRFHRIIGKSPNMLALYRILERVSKTDLPVLIEGESGTGKELVANAVHFNSDRKKREFLSENCGALAETVFESELFGHVRGAFTGAEADREGLFALADQGTLFLDEVHELSLGMQKKLLRVLQEGEFRPVGGKDVRRVNVRVIAASNRPLFQLVREGRFREDLYYRLNVLKVEIPPLRERGGDILLLARHFLADVCREQSLDAREFSAESLQQLVSYGYPGNVRELLNVVEKAAIFADSRLIGPELLFFDQPADPDAPQSIDGLCRIPLKDAKEEFQRSYLESSLDLNDRVVSRAARHSGITRESFHRLMKKYGIQR